MTGVAMQSFGFGDHLVRAGERCGQIWFVAKDVCAALNLTNHRVAASALDDDEKDEVSLTDAIGRVQNWMAMKKMMSV